MDIPVRHLPHDGQECPSYIVPGNLCAGAYPTARENLLVRQLEVSSIGMLFWPGWTVTWMPDFRGLLYF